MPHPLNNLKFNTAKSNTPDLWIGIPGAGTQERNGRKTAGKTKTETQVLRLPGLVLYYLPHLTQNPNKSTSLSDFFFDLPDDALRF